MKIRSTPHKPIIGISTNLLKIAEKPFANHERIYVNSGYVDSILQAGGIPLLLPVMDDVEATTHMLSLVDGLVLSGGQDVHPSFYNEEPHPLLGETAKKRDDHELRLIQIASKECIPILGICRGLQLINVAFGGTLYQDLSLYSSFPHSLIDNIDASCHRVDLIPETILHRIFGKDHIIANSFHHQAVKDLAPGFHVSAKAEDNVIEGIVKAESSWILGVQWHPEVMINAQPEMRKLFETFIAEAKRYRSDSR